MTLGDVFAQKIPGITGRAGDGMMTFVAPVRHAIDGADLSAAVAIADDIAARAVWSGEAAAFHGAAAPSQMGLPVVHRSFGGDVYEGSAGIARFLAVAAVHSGSDDLAALARGATTHALARAVGPSLFSGATGAGLVALEVGALLDEPGIADRGAGLLESGSADASLRDAPNDDLIAGLAGTLFAVVAAAASGIAGDWLARARRIGETLVAAAVVPDDVPDALAWPLQPGGPLLCGLGHGASGAALALEALARIDDDPRWAESAAAARRYERAWYSPAAGSWADLRENQVSYPHMWCHGSVGVAAERLSAVIDGTTDAMAASDLAGGLAGARAAASALVDLPTGPGGSHAINGSQCHGLGGMSDLFVDAARADAGRRADWLGLARRCTDQMVRDARRAEGWRSGIYPNGDRTPGLMLGLAGIGWALLRVARPDEVPSAWRIGGLLPGSGRA